MGIIASPLSTSSKNLATIAMSKYPPKTALAKRTISSYQQDPSYGSEAVDLLYRAQQDAEAFQELQAYADYQNTLSSSVNDELVREEKGLSIDPSILSTGRQLYNNPQYQSYTSPSPQGRAKQLPRPIIIPQQAPKTLGSEGFTLFPPLLTDYGIDEEPFLDFLRAFNNSDKSSLSSDAIDVASFGGDFALDFPPGLLSVMISVAVRKANLVQKDTKTSDLLALANKELFIPHDLFAAIITYNPTSPLDVVSPSLPSPYATFSPIPGSPVSEYLSVMFPGSDTTPNAPRLESKHSERIPVDYGESRAQLRYEKGKRHIGKLKRDTSMSSDEGDFGDSGVLDSMSGGSDERKGYEGFIQGQEGRTMETGAFYLMIVDKPMLYSFPSSSCYNSPSTTPQALAHFHPAKRLKSPVALEPDPRHFHGMWMPDSGLGWVSEALARSMGGDGPRSPLSIYESPSPNERGSSSHDKRENGKERVHSQYCDLTP